jgi:hypothetical protein
MKHTDMKNVDEDDVRLEVSDVRGVRTGQGIVCKESDDCQTFVDRELSWLPVTMEIAPLQLLERMMLADTTGEWIAIVSSSEKHTRNIHIELPPQTLVVQLSDIVKTKHRIWSGIFIGRDCLTEACQDFILCGSRCTTVLILDNPVHTQLFQFAQRARHINVKFEWISKYQPQLQPNINPTSTAQMHILLRCFQNPIPKPSQNFF